MAGACSPSSAPLPPPPSPLHACPAPCSCVCLCLAGVALRARSLLGSFTEHLGTKLRVLKPGEFKTLKLERTAGLGAAEYDYSRLQSGHRRSSSGSGKGKTKGKEKGALSLRKR